MPPIARERHRRDEEDHQELVRIVAKRFLELREKQAPKTTSASRVHVRQNKPGARGSLDSVGQFSECHTPNAYDATRTMAAFWTVTSRERRRMANDGDSDRERKRCSHPPPVDGADCISDRNRNPEGRTASAECARAGPPPEDSPQHGQ